jgi:hypothetical protein
MHAAITFPENRLRTKRAGSLKRIQAIKPIKQFQQFIEESDWDERLLGYEKYMNRFFCGIIIPSSIFFIPICISIFSR